MGGVHHIIPRHAYVHGGHYSMQHGGEGDGMRGIKLHTSTMQNQMSKKISSTLVTHYVCPLLTLSTSIYSIMGE